MNEDLIKRAEDVLEALDEQRRESKEMRECKNCTHGNQYTHPSPCEKHASMPFGFMTGSSNAAPPLEETFKELLSAIKDKEPVTDCDQTKIMQKPGNEITRGNGFCSPAKLIAKHVMNTFPPEEKPIWISYQQPIIES